MFSEKAPEGSFTDTLQDVYYSKPGETKLLSDVTLEKQVAYREVLTDAVKAGLLNPEQAAQRQSDFENGKIGPYKASPKNAAGAGALDILNEMEDDQFCLIRHPQQCGDGLYRPMDFYISPGHLTLKAAAQGWEVSKSADGADIPVADVVVVGAGPGGLMTSWQLARRGGRVVCFESELAGANFNDSGAKPVHHMRTSSDLTNLIDEGHSAAQLEHPLSLSGTIDVSRPHAQHGRDAQHALTGETMHGVYSDIVGSSDTTVPATRGELWNHLSNIAHSTANDFDNAVLCERSPVNSIEYGEDGLFEVTTTRGHRIKCKELVLAQGLTGPQGEQAKSLSILDSLHKQDVDKSVLLQRVSDTQSYAEKLNNMTYGVDSSTMIVNDRMLGDQTFRQTFAAIPAGEHAAMIGSGESGVKGALEMAYLNPDITIDLFVKGKLESAQVQVPSENFHPAVIEGTLGDDQMAHTLKDMYKFFDTPVTPRSLQECMEMQAAGRMRIFELGQYFDEKSVKLNVQEDGSTLLEFVEPKVVEILAQSEADYKSKGLMPQDLSYATPTKYRAFVQAPGYNKVPLEKNPLNQFPEEARSRVHANTITSSLHPAQSALPGLGTAGRKLAEELAERLVPAERRQDIVNPSDRGTDWQNWSGKDINAIITNLGGDPKVAEEIKEEIAQTGFSKREYQLYLTGADPKLRSIAEKPEAERTPAEKEILERGLTLGKRLYEAVPTYYKDLLPAS